MPRTRRTASPTGYYHVIMRGNNRENIFNDICNKKDFLFELYKKINENLLEIVAYCIMSNHVHLLLKANLDDLSKSFKIINQKFAHKFNKRNNRIGHVFQDRFLSEPIDNSSYLLNVVRYIHNNPVKAKIVNTPNSYKWSSYNDYLESYTNLINPILSVKQKEIILNFFSNLKHFEIYHTEYDFNDYLDIKDDTNNYRIYCGKEIISDYLQILNLNCISQLKENPNALNNIIITLLDKTKLTCNQVAKLLNLNKNYVQKIKYK